MLEHFHLIFLLSSTVVCAESIIRLSLSSGRFPPLTRLSTFLRTSRALPFIPGALLADPRMGE